MEDNKLAQKSPAPIEIPDNFYQFAKNESTEHFYILFNSASHPRLPQQYYSLEPEQQYIGLLQDLLDGYNEQSIPVMPYLVKINPNNIEQNPFIHWLFSTAETRSSFFALSSDCDLNTVAAHWNSIALVHSSQQQSVILRLFDGRISKRFLPRISPSERDALLGPCHSLWIPDEISTPCLMINNTASVIPQIKTAPWFHLTQEHESLLAGNGNKSLRYNLTLYLWENHADTLSQQVPELIEQLITQGLKKAQALGFTLTSSICQCVSLFVEYSPVFYRHKDIQKLWAQPANEHQQLVALSEKITPQQWQQIAQQFNIDDWMDIPQKPVAIIAHT